eukprot:13111681-Ditylum_brightwellii.AAC.1
MDDNDGKDTRRAKTGRMNDTITGAVADPLLHTKVQKFFTGYGCFNGCAVKVFGDSDDDKKYLVHFDDDDREYIPYNDIQEATRQADIPVGDLGFRFIRHFHGGGYLSGNVIENLNNGKRNCKFEEDGDKQTYTLAQISKHVKNQQAVMMGCSSSEEEGSSSSDNDKQSITSSGYESGNNTEDKCSTGASDDDSALSDRASINSHESNNNKEYFEKENGLEITT